MANEAYTGYTEQDVPGRLTVAANDLTVTNLDDDEDVYLYSDKGANYFSGDFSHNLTFQLSSVTGTPFLCLWALWNTAGNVGAEMASPSGAVLGVYTNGTQLILLEGQTGASYTATVNISEDTTYYVRITRDESVGTYGTLYLHVYSDSQFVNLIGSATVALHAKDDFRYLYAMSGRTGGAGSTAVTGTISDLQLDPYAYSLSNLRTRIRDILNEDTAVFWTDAELNRYINDAERDIAIKAMCLQHIDSLATAAAGTMPFTSSGLLDSNIVETYLRTVTFTGYRTQFLEYLESAAKGIGLNAIFTSLFGHTPSLGSAPVNWYGRRENLYIEPNPGSAYNLKAYVADYPSSEMAVNSDIPQIPPAFRPLIILYAVAMCLLKDRRVAQALMVYGMYVTELMYNRYNLVEIIPDTKAMTNSNEFNKVTEP
jgi:hypothetical protein